MIEDRISNFLWLVCATLLIATILSACQGRQPDVLDDLGQQVLKTKRGLLIDIEPQEEKR